MVQYKNPLRKICEVWNTQGQKYTVLNIGVRPVFWMEDRFVPVRIIWIDPSLLDPKTILNKAKNVTSKTERDRRYRIQRRRENGSNHFWTEFNMLWAAIT